MTNKSIIIAILTLTFGLFAASNSFAQKLCLLGVGTGCTTGGPAGGKDIHYKNGGQYYGHLTVFETHFEIDSIGGGDSIKAYKHSCKSVSGGTQCPFAYFNNQGVHIHTGTALFLDNGEIWTIYTYESLGGGNWRALNNQQWYVFN